MTRRLGEAGRIPRGPRGRAASEIQGRDLAQVLIGLMSVADGFEGTVARVVGAVDHLAALNCRGRLIRAEGDSLEELENPLIVVPGGSFLDQLTYMLDECRDPRTSARFMFHASSIGPTFHPDAASAWVEITGRGESLDSSAINCTSSSAVNCNSYSRRAIFGVWPDDKAAGMIREVRLSIDSLIALAEEITGKLTAFDDLDIDGPLAAHQSSTGRSGRKGGR